MAEWLRRGLQILAHRFDSGPRLQTFSKLPEIAPVLFCLGSSIAAQVSGMRPQTFSLDMARNAEIIARKSYIIIGSLKAALL